MIELGIDVIPQIVSISGADLVGPLPPDLPEAPDLAMPADFAVVPDLAVVTDLAAPPDLVALPDLTSSPDLAVGRCNNVSFAGASTACDANPRRALIIGRTAEIRVDSRSIVASFIPHLPITIIHDP